MRLLLLFLLLATPAHADVREAASTLRQFYDVYLQLGHATPLQRLEALHARVEPALYDPLRQSLLNGGPGFDPFTQVAAADGVNVELLAGQGSEARVRARVFSPAGSPVLEIWLRRSAAGWRIANVVYPDGRDLLTLLRL